SGIVGSDGKPLPQAGYARAFAEDRGGTIWALTFVEPMKHVHLLRIKNLRVEADTRVDDVIRAHYMISDETGALWLGSYDGELARVRNGHAELVARLAGSAATLTGYSLFHDADGAVWFATSRGLYRWSDGHASRMDSSNGLPCSSI